MGIDQNKQKKKKKLQTTDYLISHDESKSKKQKIG